MLRSNAATKTLKCFFVLLLSLSIVPIAPAQTAAVPPEVTAFLRHYMQGDEAAVLADVAPDVVIYGTDAAEVFRGRDAVRRMLAQDQQLWQHSAHLGDMQNVSMHREGKVLSLFFDAPFTVGTNPPVTVRFAMVWRKSGDRWLLVQSANTVPTTHQSAEELLSGGGK